MARPPPPHSRSTTCPAASHVDGGRGTRAIERAVLAHPGLVRAARGAMVVLYLVLLVGPAVLPASAADAAVVARFAKLSQFVFWGVWWPFVVLSTLLFGRAWCGLLCPEGTLTELASTRGAHRPVPSWMRWGGIPLLSFLGVTIVGQLLEVDENPLSQLVVLGGSTLMAVAVGLVYGRKTRVWCRFLCPVSMLFGVFSRLGALHFGVDKKRVAEAAHAPPGPDKQRCPVLIHLPTLSTNRDCIMCFGCAGWRDAIHLRLRRPGEEILRMHDAQPMLWEVLFLFGGAVGLPLGVFLGEKLDLHGPVLAIVLLTATAAGVLVLAGSTAFTVHVSRGAAGAPPSFRERFTMSGYALTPISLFSLFLGLSQSTFEELSRWGLSSAVGTALRLALLFGGAGWSLLLLGRLLQLQRGSERGLLPAALPLATGILVVLGAWLGVLVG